MCVTFSFLNIRDIIFETWVKFQFRIGDFINYWLHVPSNEPPPPLICGLMVVWTSNCNVLKKDFLFVIWEVKSDSAQDNPCTCFMAKYQKSRLLHVWYNVLLCKIPYVEESNLRNIWYLQWCFMTKIAGIGCRKWMYYRLNNCIEWK